MYFNDCFRKTNTGITKTEWVSECWLLTILYLETNQIFLCKVQATWRTKQKQTCSLIQSWMFLWCQFVITAKFISDIEWMIIWRLKTVSFQWHCRKEREFKNQQVQQADQTKEKACYDFARLFIFGLLKFLVTPCLKKHIWNERELKNQQVQQADQTKEKACYDFARLFIFGQLKFLVTPCL